MQADPSDSRTSSPDPLALSYDDRDTQHPMSSPHRHTPLRETSPNKRTLRERHSARKAETLTGHQPNTSKLSTPVRWHKDIARVGTRSAQTFHLNTPDKLSGDKTNSPLKIRVIIEREGFDETSESLTMDSPSRRNARTKKVPLKDDGGNPPQRRTRPRKSEAHLLSGMNRLQEEIPIPVGIDKISKDSSHTGNAGSTPLPPASFSDEAQTHKTTLLDFAAITPLHKKAEHFYLTQTPRMLNLLPNGSEVKLIRDRVPTPRKPPGWESPAEEASFEDPSIDVAQYGHADVEDDTPLPQFDGHNEEDIEEQLAPQILDMSTQFPQSEDDEDPNLYVSGWDASFPDDSSLKDAEADHHEEDVTGLADDTVALNRSAVESEGFSMISFHSLKQQRELAEREAMRTQEAATKYDHDVSNYMFGTETRQESIRQANLGRSVTTPSQIQETSPSPPRLSPSPLKQSPTRKISSAVRAGSVLQEALSSPADPSASTNGDIFAGFGDGTRKQMRRSIVVGELLARAEPTFQLEATRMSSHPPTFAPGNDSSLGRLPTPEESLASINGPGSAERVDTGQLENQPGPSAHRKPDEMSWRYAGLPDQFQRHETAYDSMSWRPTTPPPTNENMSDETQLSHTQILELRHQRERENVIREAQEVNSSQIMVIDSSIAAGRTFRNITSLSPTIPLGQQNASDNSTVQQNLNSPNVEDHRTQREVSAQVEDIFLDEADRSLEDSMNNQSSRRDERSSKLYRPPNCTSLNTRNPKSLLRALPKHTPNFDDILGADDQPMRGKLPRTWRRVTGSALIYSDESGATPEKVRQPAPRSTGKRGCASLTSTNEDDCVPTVFKRLRPSFREVEREGRPSSHGPPGTKHAEIPSSPSRRSSPLPQSSPPKEVRFMSVGTDRNHAIVADESYFSSDAEQENESVPEYGNEDENVDDFAGDHTFVVGQTNRIRAHDDRSSILDHSRHTASMSANSPPHETSDTRQLVREMRSDYTIPSTKALAGINLSPRKDRGRSNLFEPKSHAGPAPPLTSTVLEPDFRKLSSATRANFKSGLLARAASWLWPPSYFVAPHFPAEPSHSSKTSDASQPKVENLDWNHNHYALLTHYHRLAHGIRSPGPILPAAFYERPVPDKKLRAYIGQEFTTTPRCGPHCGSSCTFGASTKPLDRTERKPSKSYAAIFTELDARVAWAFMSEVLTRGVPLIRGEDRSGQQGIVRDQLTGKVKRLRERWTAEEVALSVFSVGIVDSIEADLGSYS